MAIDETMSIPTEEANQQSTAPTRMGYLLARKHRIEHWAYKGRSSSISDTATMASAVLGTQSAQKRSESSYSQAGRVLNIRLLQLSEQRQKVIDQNNFDQKLFANKQALKHKDNQNVLRTLSYVRKCCKYTDTNDSEKTKINPAIFLEENSTIKRSRSRSPSSASPTLKRPVSANPRTQTSASMAETFLKHNKKHLGSYPTSPLGRKLADSKTTSYTPTSINPSETPNDEDAQKRHVQFQINPDGTQLTSQSAHVIANKQMIRTVASANGIRTSNSSHDTRTTNSAPLIRTLSAATDHSNTSVKPQRSLSRISSAKHSLQEFRLHPERFLSASNRYLPLLRRQSFSAQPKDLHPKQQKERKSKTHFSPPISRLSDGSDLTYDDAKSFLSEEHDPEKYNPQSEGPAWLEGNRKTAPKIQSPTKINLMNTIDDDESEERRFALSRLRDREYSHLQDLIRSNPIEQILEPFSAIKTDEHQPIVTSNQKRQLTTSMKSTRIRQLGDILRSIDSLGCADTADRRTRRQVDIEKNRAKLGILIF